MSEKMNPLSTDAGFSSVQGIEISKSSIAKNTIAIREIHLDDLLYVEKELAFHEKVFSFFFSTISKCSAGVINIISECCQFMHKHNV